MIRWGRAGTAKLAASASFTSGTYKPGNTNHQLKGRTQGDERPRVPGHRSRFAAPVLSNNVNHAGFGADDRQHLRDTSAAEPEHTGAGGRPGKAKLMARGEGETWFFLRRGEAIAEPHRTDRADAPRRGSYPRRSATPYTGTSTVARETRPTIPVDDELRLALQRSTAVKLLTVVALPR